MRPPVTAKYLARKLAANTDGLPPDVIALGGLAVQSLGAMNEKAY